MNLKFSTTYHLEFDGQIERVNRVIEDILRMYVMDKPSRSEDYHLLCRIRLQQWVSCIIEDEPI
jgi:hypothetical protein